jgi:hypothetical protein
MRLNTSLVLNSPCGLSLPSRPIASSSCQQDRQPYHSCTARRLVQSIEMASRLDAHTHTHTPSGGLSVAGRSKGGPLVNLRRSGWQVVGLKVTFLPLRTRGLLVLLVQPATGRAASQPKIKSSTRTGIQQHAFWASSPRLFCFCSAPWALCPAIE